MPLSHSDIIQKRTEGGIFIQPFSTANLGTSSYDITLGDTFIRSHPGVDNTIQNPWSSDYNYWGEPSYATRVTTQDQASLLGLLMGDRYFLIHPEELVLAHTNEFIGSTPGSGITTEMKARSSIGRVGLTICSCAGLGDVGYHNRWCMEIKNHSKCDLVLKVGERIGQIVFETVPNCTANYAPRGHYQTTTEPAETMASWNPQMLYPRFNQVRRV